MKAGGVVALAVGVAFGIGFFAGTWVGGPSPSHDANSGEELAASVARMARALERVETKLATAAPMSATRPSDPGSTPGNADIAKMLADITERLNGLSSTQGGGLTPGTPRERTTEQAARLRPLGEEEAQAVQEKHFMLTGRDLLVHYGVPDRAYFWTASTIRWVYLLDREAPSTSARAVFALMDDYVVSASLERAP